MKPVTAIHRSRVLAVALVLVTLAGVVATGPEARAARNPHRGTWVLHEASSVAALNRAAPGIRRALRLNGVVGLSIRVPWSALERRKGHYDFRVLRRARRIAGSNLLAVRFIAGRSTPAFRRGNAMVYDGSATGGRGRGVVVPLPFGRHGGPNRTFERGWRKLVNHLASWSKRHRVRILHLSWPGLLWAELALVDQMMRQPGYSYGAAKATHLRLLRYGLRKSTRRMSVGFATTGHAPNQLRMDIQRRLLASRKWRRCYMQANNVAPGGSGLPSAPPPPKRGAQMVGGSNTYDWASVYRAVRRMHATYLEVYSSSFRGGTSAQLAREAARFA
jgi:hypothetical protein